MPIAIGGSKSTAGLPLGPLSVSVTDFGARADGTTDCSPAFEAAYASLIARLNSVNNNTYGALRGVIRWPAAARPYLISRPMKVEDPYVSIAGDGQGSVVQTTNGNSAILFGIRTTEAYAGGTLQLRNAISSLASAHAVNATTLTVNAGDGPMFGNPTPNYPIRMVVTDPNSKNVSIYAAIGRTGDTFTLQTNGSSPTLYDGNAADNAFSAGARVENVHRPDLYGKLDTSFAPVSGQKFGVRLNGDATLFFQANPLSLGQILADNQTLDNWGSTSKLTLEFCVEPPNGKQFAGGVVFSMGTYSSPMPMAVTISGNPNAFDFWFKTSDGVSHYVEFGAGASATGPMKMAVQIDLGARTVQAYANGVQVAVTPGDSFFNGGAPLTFARNEYATLLFGNAYSDTRPMTSTGSWASYDLRLYGFALSGRFRYKNSGVGQPQQRLDGGTVNDAYRYASGDYSDTNIIGYLPMTDQPSTNRMVTASIVGNRQGYGYLVQNAMYSLLGGIQFNGLSDIQLIGPGFGPVVVIGAALDLTILRCTISNGTHAIGTLNLLANYVLKVRDCTLGGTDAGIYSAWQIVEAANLRFQTCGRVPIRLWASDATFHDVFITNFGSTYTESIIKMHAGLYGGTYRIEDVTVDFEGEGLTVAPIYVEQHPTSAVVTNCLVNNFYIGSVGASPALIQVKTGAFDGSHYVLLDVNNFQTGGSPSTVVLDIDGPAVTGEVRNVFLPNQPPINHRQTYGTGCNVVVRDATRKAPPRSFGWYPGAHILDVRSVVDGQFAEWRCLVAGTYGTPTPPQWAGVNPVASKSSSLASYVLSHAYMTAALS